MPKPITTEFSEIDVDLTSKICKYRSDISSAFTADHFLIPRPNHPNLIVDVLVGLIISECVNTLNTHRVARSSLVFGVFENSISLLSAQVRDYTKMEKLSENIIQSEKSFMLQVSDIREELSMIKSVLLEQEQVWQRFMKAKFPEFWPNSPGDQHVLPSHFNGRMLKVLENLEKPQTQFATYKRQIAILEADAERVAHSIELLLDLKSRHTALHEAHLATLMSSAIIGFTVVTIIFTPLAFLVGLFALSINHFQEHQSNSNLTNGAPFYDSTYVGKWLGELNTLQMRQ